MIGRINFPIVPRLNLDRVDLAGFSVYPCGWVWDYKRLSGCDVCSEEISLNSEKIPYKMKFETDFGKELAWCETKCKTHCGHPFWYQMTRFIIGINLWVFAILVCYFRGPVFSKYAPREAETKKTIGISMVASYDLCIDLPRKSQKFQKVGQFGMTIGNNFRNIGTILWFAILDLNLLSTCIVCSSIKHILDKFFSIKICSFCLKGKIETIIIGTQRFFQKCHPLFVENQQFQRIRTRGWTSLEKWNDPGWTVMDKRVLPCSTMLSWRQERNEFPQARGVQSPTFFPKHVRGCPWGGMARDVWILPCQDATLSKRQAVSWFSRLGRQSFLAETGNLWDTGWRRWRWIWHFWIQGFRPKLSHSIPIRLVQRLETWRVAVVSWVVWWEQDGNTPYRPCKLSV